MSIGAAGTLPLEMALDVTVPGAVLPKPLAVGRIVRANFCIPLGETYRVHPAEIERLEGECGPG